jgi:uncharacterized protein with HEPN domain
MRNDTTYVQHMIEAIETIQAYIGECTFEAFVDNRMMVDAVVRELEILGEAANQVSEALKDKHPEIPWFKMRGLRNFVIHEYFAVNEKIVWDTCKENLPGLKVQLEQVTRA